MGSYDEIATNIARNSDGYRNDVFRIVCDLYSDAYKAKKILSLFYPDTDIMPYFEKGCFSGYLVTAARVAEEY